MPPDPRHTWQYQKARTRWIRTASGDCCICGWPVDKSLGGMHPWGPTVEHTVEVARDPTRALDTSLWRLAHARCNALKGARYGAQRKAAKRTGPPPIRPEREW